MLNTSVQDQQARFILGLRIAESNTQRERFHCVEMPQVTKQVLLSIRSLARANCLRDADQKQKGINASLDVLVAFCEKFEEENNVKIN